MASQALSRSALAGGLLRICALSQEGRPSIPGAVFLAAPRFGRPALAGLDVCCLGVAHGLHTTQDAVSAAEAEPHCAQAIRMDPLQIKAP